MSSDKLILLTLWMVIAVGITATAVQWLGNYKDYRTAQGLTRLCLEAGGHQIIDYKGELACAQVIDMRIPE